MIFDLRRINFPLMQSSVCFMDTLGLKKATDAIILLNDDGLLNMMLCFLKAHHFSLLKELL